MLKMILYGTCNILYVTTALILIIIALIDMSYAHSEHMCEFNHFIISNYDHMGKLRSTQFHLQKFASLLSLFICVFLFSF